MGSESLFTSKSARKFYSQKSKEQVVSRYTRHFSLDTSQDLTPGLKINESEENRYYGTPIKRKYKSANSCSKRRYKSTGEYTKCVEVATNDSCRLEVTDTSQSPCGGDSNSETTIAVETNSSLLTTSSPESNVSQHNSCSNTQQTSGTSCKNIYYHDRIFWTTNFYGKKAQQQSSSRTSMSNNNYTENGNLNNNLNTSTNCSEMKDVGSSKSSVISSASLTNSESVNKKNELECTPQKETCKGVSISKDGPCINSNTSFENDVCERIRAEPLPVVSQEAVNVSFDDSVTTRSRLSTPNSMPSTPKLHKNICTSTPLQSLLPRHDNDDISSTISPTSISCNNTPISTSSQLPLKDCIGEVYKYDLNSSLSSMDSSFTSTINTSLEDEQSEKVNDVICKLVINPSNAKKEFKNKSDSKKAKNVNTILNYFTKTSPHKKKMKKTVARECDDSSVGEVTKKKKKGVLTVCPMFDLPISPRLNSSYKRGSVQSRMKDKKSTKTNKMEQMYIDIGQKNFGHVKCPTCGMIYTECQEDDEAQHARFHQKIIAKLHFKSWKDERIVQEFHDGRIIMIASDDHPSHLKKLAEVKEVVDAELGFTGVQNSYPNTEQQAFLFIMAKKVLGCAIALHITKAFPVIPHSDSKSSGSENSSPSAAWCCSADPVAAQCGVSRVWVISHNRRQKIASRLVDCIRYNFLYGCVIPKEKIAFSDPTPNGRSFAEKYTGKSAILVFR